jgi:hypothetical protein
MGPRDEDQMPKPEIQKASAQPSPDRSFLVPQFVLDNLATAVQVPTALKHVGRSSSLSGHHDYGGALPALRISQTRLTRGGLVLECDNLSRRCKAHVSRRLYISQMDDDLQKAKLKAELLARNYPWPEMLNSKNRHWLENELRILKPLPNRRIYPPRRTKCCGSGK